MSPADASRAVLRALRGGARTPGAIASAAGLGVTQAYQTIERGIDAGRIEWAREAPAPSYLREVS